MKQEEQSMGAAVRAASAARTEARASEGLTGAAGERAQTAPLVSRGPARAGDVRAGEEDQALATHVRRAVRSYFETLGSEPIDDLYQVVLSEVERPLLQVVMERSRGNQSRAANTLGLSRGTLRRKLKDHGLLR